MAWSSSSRTVLATEPDILPELATHLLKAGQTAAPWVAWIAQYLTTGDSPLYMLVYFLLIAGDSFRRTRMRGSLMASESFLSLTASSRKAPSCVLLTAPRSSPPWRPGAAGSRIRAAP